MHGTHTLLLLLLLLKFLFRIIKVDKIHLGRANIPHSKISKVKISFM